MSNHAQVAIAYFGRVDADMDSGAVDLLALNALDVDDKLLAVDLHHLPDLLTLVMTSHHLAKTSNTFTTC